MKKLIAAHLILFFCPCVKAEKHFSLSQEFSPIEYREPDSLNLSGVIMKETGFMQNVSGSATFHCDSAMIKADARFGSGRVDYVSGGGGKSDALRDYQFETRITSGYRRFGCYLGCSSRSEFPVLGLKYILLGTPNQEPFIDRWCSSTFSSNTLTCLKRFWLFRNLLL
jgi:hypothetical protein